MNKVGLFPEPHYWYPFTSWGLTGSFWRITSETVINTWAVFAVLIVFIIVARIALHNEHGIGRFLVVSYVKSLKELVEQGLGFFNFNHFCFIASLFTFIILCNFISLIPGREEPTSDLSTTLALGLCQFLYVQGSSIRANGIGGYLKEFVEPFFFMLPLHVVGLFATIISISFRLFGNIFGGVVISKLYLNAIGGNIIRELAGIMSGLNIVIALFFIIFEGIIQAFVFSMLSLTYLSLAVSKEESHG